MDGEGTDVFGVVLGELPVLPVDAPRVLPLAGRAGLMVEWLPAEFEEVVLGIVSAPKMITISTLSALILTPGGGSVTSLALRVFFTKSSVLGLGLT